jgi:Protein of unknown function (DUF2750)
MSVAAAQYDKFKQQVVADGLAWTFTEADDYLVFPVREGEAVPFWSSQSRLKKVCKYHPKYSRYQQVSLPLAEFLELLPRLQADKVSIGVNWSGERLVGYDVSADSLLAGLQYYIDKRNEPSA